ncbi:hypothetical protein PROFUN_05257 [Planoprotostelium fungivorum]|uniref:Inner centromere protein ARK-binding domain-containing protein n=1 Tax=Planoprotostelium fungivorum TaxID=1890364 RepID=A0A2P6NR91_9EUKA|nr:hypothetical protein PROFUN_05257 [Planoprotostelium fungivorum]
MSSSRLERQENVSSFRNKIEEAFHSQMLDFNTCFEANMLHLTSGSLMEFGKQCSFNSLKTTPNQKFELGMRANTLHGDASNLLKNGLGAMPSPRMKRLAGAGFGKHSKQRLLAKHKSQVFAPPIAIPSFKKDDPNKENICGVKRAGEPIELVRRSARLNSKRFRETLTELKAKEEADRQVKENMEKEKQEMEERMRAEMKAVEEEKRREEEKMAREEKRRREEQQEKKRLSLQRREEKKREEARFEELKREEAQRQEEKRYQEERRRSAERKREAEFKRAALEEERLREEKRREEEERIEKLRLAEEEQRRVEADVREMIESTMDTSLCSIEESDFEAKLAREVMEMQQQRLANAELLDICSGRPIVQEVTSVTQPLLPLSTNHTKISPWLAQVISNPQTGAEVAVGLEDIERDMMRDDEFDDDLEFHSMEEPPAEEMEGPLVDEMEDPVEDVREEMAMMIDDRVIEERDEEHEEVQMVRSIELSVEVDGVSTPPTIVESQPEPTTPPRKVKTDVTAPEMKYVSKIMIPKNNTKPTATTTKPVTTKPTTTAAPQRDLDTAKIPTFKPSTTTVPPVKSTSNTVPPVRVTGVTVSSAKERAQPKVPTFRPRLKENEKKDLDLMPPPLFSPIRVQQKPPSLVRSPIQGHLYRIRVQKITDCLKRFSKAVQVFTPVDFDGTSTTYNILTKEYLCKLKPMLLVEEFSQLLGKLKDIGWKDTRDYQGFTGQPSKELYLRHLYDMSKHIEESSKERAEVLSLQKSYVMSEYMSSCSESESDDEEDKGGCVPSWAYGKGLQDALFEQQFADPDSIFPSVNSCDLEEIFHCPGGSSTNLGMQLKYKKRMEKRTSSGNWTHDGGYEGFCIYACDSVNLASESVLMLCVVSNGFQLLKQRKEQRSDEYATEKFLPYATRASPLASENQRRSSAVVVITFSDPSHIMADTRVMVQSTGCEPNTKKQKLAGNDRGLLLRNEISRAEGEILWLKDEIDRVKRRRQELSQQVNELEILSANQIRGERDREKPRPSKPSPSSSSKEVRHRPREVNQTTDWRTMIARLHSLTRDDETFPKLDFKKDEDIIRWVNSVVRSRQLGTISSDIEDALSSMHFDWKQVKKNSDWENSYIRLIELGRVSGGTFELSRARQFEADTYFKTWLSNLKQAYRQGRVPAEKLKQLKDIGFMSGRERREEDRDSSDDDSGDEEEDDDDELRMAKRLSANLARMKPVERTRERMPRKREETKSSAKAQSTATQSPAKSQPTPTKSPTTKKEEPPVTVEPKRIAEKNEPPNTTTSIDRGNDYQVCKRMYESGADTTDFMQHLLVWNWFKCHLLEDEERRDMMQSYEALSRDQFSEILSLNPGTSQFPSCAVQDPKSFLAEVYQWYLISLPSTLPFKIYSQDGKLHLRVTKDIWMDRIRGVVFFASRAGTMDKLIREDMPAIYEVKHVSTSKWGIICGPLALVKQDPDSSYSLSKASARAPRYFECFKNQQHLQVVVKGWTEIRVGEEVLLIATWLTLFSYSLLLRHSTYSCNII